MILFAITVSFITGFLEIELSPYVIDQRTYSTVNVVVEILRIVLAFSVFGVVWITRRFRLDQRSLTVALVFLSVGILTILRLLTFPLMPTLLGPAENPDHSCYFNAFLRLTLGIGMLASGFLSQNRQVESRKAWLLLTVSLLYSVAVGALVLMPSSPLPDLFGDGIGIAPLRVELEYGSMAVLFVAAMVYARIVSKLPDVRLSLVAVGLILIAQAGFGFLEDQSTFDLVFLMGRMTALVGFFLVFYAFMRISLVRPYEELEKASQDLNINKREVENKTAELRALAQDLTERKLVEAALKRSEKSYRELVDTATEGIWRGDAEDKTVFVNPQLAAMLGYSVDEMIGKPLIDFTAPDVRALVERRLERRREGEADRYDLAMVRKDGQRVIVLVSETQTKNDLGAYVGSVAFLSDITDIKRAEEALRTSERTLFKFLESMPVGIVVCDPKGKHLYSNEKSQQLLGKGVDPSLPPEMAPSFYQAYVAGTDQPYPNERAPLFRALKGESSMVDDVEIRKPDTFFRLEVWGTPITDSEGKVLYGIAVFQDITERKQTEQRIIDLNKSLEEQAGHLTDVNRELEAFSYSVSHDLRAPLRSIDGFSNILIEDYSGVLDDQGKDYLKRVRAGCQRMGQLIDDLLKLSRVTRDEMTLGTVDLSKVAGGVLAELKKLQPDRKVKIVIEDKAVIWGDTHLFRILLTNLLGNSWKFTAKQPKPVIEFGTTTIGGEKVYYVRDNGAGFDMKYADKLFMPFQRLHSSDEFAGSGIGLATAQRIVHRHGGRIWAEGEVSKGATFFFTVGIRGKSTSRSSATE